VSGLPKQVPFIIGNEACERFSFYGMRNILVTFLSTYLLASMGPSEAKLAAVESFHTFVIGVYFFPLLGGFLADRVFGRYNTIFWVSLLYCVGHLMLAVFENNRDGFFAGLFLIALGSGGIKPCVSSFVGDQFTAAQSHLAKRVFDAFYWSINFGSFFASLLMPVLLRNYGPRVAFGVPGVLMGVATVVFFLGRKHYRRVPPAPADPHGFFRILWRAASSHRGGLRLFGLSLSLAGTALFFHKELGVVASICIAMVTVFAALTMAASVQLHRIEAEHPPEAIAGFRAVVRLLVLFALVTPFWSLFDQKASTWVLQADAMTKPAWFASSQMQALNPLLVMLLIPFNQLVLLPQLKNRGIVPTPLQKMGTGIALAGVAYVAVAVIQWFVGQGVAVDIRWQIVPYVILTMGEVLVSATGLEFAYSQAPLSMKSTLMSFWSLSVTIGSLWVLLVQRTLQTDNIMGALKERGLDPVFCQMVFFSLFAFTAATVFSLVAKRTVTVERYHA
jgi:proton-dependent oligopeptide transporter, POT family